MSKIKKIFSSWKTLIIAVVLITGTAAPTVIPVVCPQYTYLIPTIEKVVEFVGIGGEDKTDAGK
jgi:hypothetical protein